MVNTGGNWKYFLFVFVVVVVVLRKFKMGF